MDSVSNFLNKLKQASRVGKTSFSFPASKFISAIADALVKKGFVASVSKKGKKGRLLEIILRAEGTEERVLNIKRVSRLSKRIYRHAREIRPLRSGFGVTFISTPKGILSDEVARKGKIGGEVLFEIW